MTRTDYASWGWLVSGDDRTPATRTEAVRALKGEEHRLRLFGRPAVWEADDEVVAEVRSYIEAMEEDWRDGLYRRRR